MKYTENIFQRELLMVINNCRVCNNNFFKEPLLKYKNMPAAVQYLPDSKSLETDKGIDLEIFQCSGCGLVQLNNDPVHYYKEVIRAVAFSEEMKEFRLEQFENFVKEYSLKGKKIIEIGCGKGEYLSLMQQFDVKAYGLEYLEESVIHGLENKLKISKGFIEDRNYKLKDSPFDAFYTLNYLEHLPNPNSILNGIYNNLSKKGVGIIEVPNFNMILRNRLFSEFTGDHLFYFTKETLSAALMKNSFEIVECKEVWNDYIISAIVKKRETPEKLRQKKIEKLNLSEFNQHQVMIKREIEKYLNHFENKRVAVWGAGHQALAILALTELSDKIKYVIDSAPFKQERYTPATHIPIVSPDTLKTTPVDSVIIMAAGYSDEVSRIIRKKYNKDIDISILRDFGLEKI